MKNFLILLFFSTLSHYGTAQIQSIPINNVHKVHQLNVNQNADRFAAIINNTVQNYEGRGNQPFSYFYEFDDGSYYVGDNSYVDRTFTEFSTFNPESKLVTFKVTAKYIDGDDPPLVVETGVGQNFRTNLPGSATEKNNSQISFLDISHNTKSIILDEEYVIAINLANEMIEAESILFLYNEKDKRIFAEGALKPRPLNSIERLKGVTDNILKDREFSNYLEFINPQRNIFINLKTLARYYRGYSSDTDSITIEAVSIVNNEPTNSIKLKLKLLPDNARAHDPNNILVSPTCIEPGKKTDKLSYTVNFQNIGGRPAKDIIIDVIIPDAIDINNLNTNTFKLHTFNQSNLRLSPPTFNYRLSNNKDTIIFTLTDINLKGTEQNNIPIKQTMGSITYDLPLNSNLNNKPIVSKATILFKDGLEGLACNNCNGCTSNSCVYPDLDPVVTPPAITTFKKFYSLKPNSVKAGLDFNKDIGIFTGITAAPNRCKQKLYNQFELMLTYQKYTCGDSSDSITGLNRIIDTTECRIYATETIDNEALNEWEVASKSYSFGVVPLHLRYSLTNSLSIGGGAEFRLTYKQGTFYQLSSGLTNRNDFLLDGSLLADLNFNASNNQLLYGLRYLYGYQINFSDNGISNSFNQLSRLQAYIQWTF